jgi:hypothetical protein
MLDEMVHTPEQDLTHLSLLNLKADEDAVAVGQMSICKLAKCRPEPLNRFMLKLSF